MVIRMVNMVFTAQTEHCPLCGQLPLLSGNPPLMNEEGRRQLGGMIFSTIKDWSYFDWC